MSTVSEWGLHLGCKFAGAGGADCAEWATIPSADKSYFVTQTGSSAVKRMCTADRRAKGVNSGISKVSDISTPCDGPDCSHGHGPLRLVNTNNKFGDMCPIVDVYQHCSTARRPPPRHGPHTTTKCFFGSIRNCDGLWAPCRTPFRPQGGKT